MNEQLESKVKDMVCDVFLAGDRSFPVERDMSLIESGICDSMGLVQLAAAMEAAFPGIKIQDQDITQEAMGTVADAAALLERLGAKV